MYKIIAFDLDGTLTNSKKEISKATKDAIMRVQKEGIKIVLASGRPTIGMMDLAKELELSKYGGYILSYNGGNIIDVAKNQILYKREVKKEYFTRIQALMQEYDVDISTYKGEYVITNNKDNLYAQIEAKINKVTIVEEKNLFDTIKEDMPKFIFLKDAGDYLGEIEPKIRASLDDILEVYRSEPYFLEILPKGIDKAKSLERLLEILGLSREELMVFGDGYNDKSMIVFAGFGIAMANAKDEVKQVADYITLSNDEDGIAFAIDKFIL